MKVGIRTAALALALAGCSVLNRDGPSVTCAELQDGAVNACEDGIIASCWFGAVSYTLCDADACEQGFQTPGAYRCSPDASVPPSDGEPSAGQ